MTGFSEPLPGSVLLNGSDGGFANAVRIPFEPRAIDRRATAPDRRGRSGAIRSAPATVRLFAIRGLDPVYVMMKPLVSRPCGCQGACGRPFAPPLPSTGDPQERRSRLECRRHA